MGFRCEYNYILRLRSSQGCPNELEPGLAFSFVKEGHRIYPVDVPIDLANEEWSIVARVVVREFTVGGGRTTGRAEVLLVYDGSECEVLTRINRAGEAANGAAP